MDEVNNNDIPFFPPGPEGNITPSGSEGDFYWDSDSAIDEAGICLGNACGLINSDIATDLDASESVLRNETAVVVGEVDNSLDQSETTYLKMLSKLNEDVNTALSIAYQSSYNLGIPVPSEFGLMFGRETGDYLGSNFVYEYNGQVIAPDWPIDVLGDPVVPLSPTIGQTDQSNSLSQEAGTMLPSPRPSTPIPNNDSDPCIQEIVSYMDRIPRQLVNGVPQPCPDGYSPSPSDGVCQRPVYSEVNVCVDLSLIHI